MGDESGTSFELWDRWDGASPPARSKVLPGGHVRVSSEIARLKPVVSGSACWDGRGIPIEKRQRSRGAEGRS